MYENINEYKHIILYINTFLTSFFKALFTVRFLPYGRPSEKS